MFNLYNGLDRIPSDDCGSEGPGEYSADAVSWTEPPKAVRVYLGEILIRLLVPIILVPPIALSVQTWISGEVLTESIFHLVSSSILFTVALCILPLAGDARRS